MLNKKRMILTLNEIHIKKFYYCQQEKISHKFERLFQNNHFLSSWKMLLNKFLTPIPQQPFQRRRHGVGQV